LTLNQQLPVLGPASASPDVLQPTNRKLVDVLVDYIVPNDAVCMLAVANSEGNVPEDVEVIDAHHVSLRAKISGRKSKLRTYTITVTCTNSAGGSSSTETAVLVSRKK
jgi:hypothetical protein